MADQFPNNNGTRKHAHANPAPLGLFGFAMTTFVLSCYNAGIGVGDGAPTNVVLGLAMFYGGLAQVLAGMWEFKGGNTFGATAFTSYGSFWLSYAVILIPGLGVVEAYSHAVGALSKALGIYLIAWTVFTFLMWTATLRTNVCLTSLFFMLFLTFALLSAGTLNDHENFTKAGGYTGIITACISWYFGLAQVVNKDISFFTLPVGTLCR